MFSYCLGGAKMTYYYKLEGAVVKSAAQIDGCEEITETEYNAMKAEAEQSESRKHAINDFMEQYKRRPLTAEEVTAMLIKQQINTLDVDDRTALRMVEFYSEWATDTAYPAGHKVQRGGRLWRCIQAHTSQTGWEPESAPSLWAKVLIPDETVIPEWEQPDSTNPYMVGDKVTHNGKTWVSDIDNNVWEPGVYGWTQQSD